jgi:site-specific DNA-methyltransferase (cytosine-N4-specific)
MTAAKHGWWEAFRYRPRGPVDLLLGDAEQVLAAMPNALVDTVVTSPPFWQLRDYGTGRWISGDPSLPAPAPLGTAGRTLPALSGRMDQSAVRLKTTVAAYVDPLAEIFESQHRQTTPLRACPCDAGRPASGRRAADSTPPACPTPTGPWLRFYVGAQSYR